MKTTTHTKAPDGSFTTIIDEGAGDPIELLEGIRGRLMLAQAQLDNQAVQAEALGTLIRDTRDDLRAELEELGTVLALLRDPPEDHEEDDVVDG